MRKAFFVWRHNSKGYDPMICYDEVPTSREPTLAPRIAKVYEIHSSYQMIYGEVCVSFAELARAYPAPIDPVEPKIKLEDMT